MPTPQSSVWRRRCKKNLPFARSYFYIYTTHGNYDGRFDSSFYSGRGPEYAAAAAAADTRLLCLRCHRPAIISVYVFRTYTVSYIKRINVRYVYYYYYNTYTPPHTYTRITLYVYKLLLFIYIYIYIIYRVYIYIYIYIICVQDDARARTRTQSHVYLRSHTCTHGYTRRDERSEVKKKKMK